MDCLINGSKTKKYSEKMRSFALNLRFHSPRAYRFVQQQFKDHLPHPQTMKKWYQLSKSNGKPGLIKVNMEALEVLVQEQKDKGEQLICGISFDEMSIRRHVEWSDAEKRFIGRVDYGFNVKNDRLPVAKNAIAFMISGINRKFLLPIAFFFIDSLNAAERKHLFLEILTALTEIGVRLISVTFDGLSTNIPMCEGLGACFDLNNFRPYFLNHITKDKIYVILDPSHMLKLVRNILATHKVFHDATGAKIEWKYFERLENFRERGLIAGHKLNKKHIQWDRNKMNVKLAAETLSESVASSMETLLKCNYPEFAECQATVKFIRFFNRLFDILNTEESDPNPFKCPISPLNKGAIFSFFEESIQFIKTLELDGQNLIDGIQRTGFRGFLINVYSVRAMYEELVETSKMDRFPTFRLSQDPLECLFGRIRSFGGFNDNPTVTQFCSAIRKLLVENGINCSEFANCKDSFDILTVPATNKLNLHSAGHCSSMEEDKDSESDSDSDSNACSELQGCEYDFSETCPADISIAHTAALIEQKIYDIGRFTCEQCVPIFTLNDKISFKLINRRTPCVNTFQICKIANNHLEVCANKYDFKYSKVLKRTLRNVNKLDMYPKISFEHNADHKQDFVQYIAEEFLRLQATHLAKSATLEQQRLMLRNKLKKAILFSGQ